MKYTKSLYLALAIAGLGSLTSCQNSFDEPTLQIPVATKHANTTIADLKEAMWQSDTNYATLCPQKENGEDYIIKGRVISSDAAGNVYKALYIQDETGAITLSINQSSLFNEYRVGQEVVIDVTGLYIGKYAGLEQIGGLGEYNGSYQVSFMSYQNFLAHAELNGLPEPATHYINCGEEYPTDGEMYCIVSDMSNMPTSDADVRAMQSQLVEFRNVHFQDGGKLTYADYQTNTSRTLLDENGASIVVRSSGYATFYNDILPEGTGTVRGLLSYFNGTWQLILRSTADCMFDSKGQKEDPYSIAEAIELQETGAAGWVKGYIVGSVKAGVAEITSNDQIIWSADGEMDNTLVIGPSADCKDVAECLVMELPQGSDLRKAVNLVDNPGAYGQEISVRGTFSKFLGQNGIVGNKGNKSEYIYGDNNGEGGGESGALEPSGSGTADDPYNVAKALQVAQANGETSDVNVYTAGYVISGSIDTGYGNATFVINDKKDGTGASITAFRFKDFNNEKFTDANKIKVGDYIVVYAPLINYKGNTPETSYGYLYSLNGSTSGGSQGGEENPTTPSDPTGAGTEDNPYDCAAIFANPTPATGVWLQGYVVGYVEGQVLSSGAKFGVPGADANYTNTNLLLGPTADCKDVSKCIPVQLPNSGDIRTTLGLGNNPSILGAHILMKGDIAKYFGQEAGFKNMSTYKIL